MKYLNFSPTRCRRGFTLFEIVIVLVLVGIVAAGIRSFIPRFDADLNTEADRLSAHLRYTQLQAQTDIHQWRLVFTSPTTYQLGPVVLPGTGFTPDIVPGTRSTEGFLTDGVTVVTGTIVQFDSWGRPVSDIGTLSVTNQTLTLSKDSQNLNLSILAETGLIQ